MTFATKKMRNVQGSLEGAENNEKIKRFLDRQIDELTEFIESMVKQDFVTPQPKNSNETPGEP